MVLEFCWFRDQIWLGSVRLGLVMIKKVGGRYVLFTKGGDRKLGSHGTYGGAAAQEAAIRASQRRKKGIARGSAGG